MDEKSKRSRVFAEKGTLGAHPCVNVWREGDQIVSTYTPDVPGYSRWRQEAERQEKTGIRPVWPTA